MCRVSFWLSRLFSAFGIRRAIAHYVEEALTTTKADGSEIYVFDVSVSPRQLIYLERDFILLGVITFVLEGWHSLLQ